MRFLMGTGLVALQILSASVIQGALITFEFTGVVTSVTDPDHDLDGLVAAGNTFSGQYTFESTTPDLLPAIAGSGSYQATDGSMFVTIGSLQIDAGRPWIWVIDRTGPDPYQGDEYFVRPVADSISAQGLQIVEFLPVSFYYLRPDVFSSDALALVPPPLPWQPNFWMQGRRNGQDHFTVQGQIETLTPEPGSLAVLSACIGLAALRRRTRQ